MNIAFDILLIIAFVVFFLMAITLLSLALLEFMDDSLGTNLCEKLGKKLGGNDK